MAERSGDSLVRILPVTLSVAELAEWEDMIEQGKLPKDHIDQYFEQLDAAVFGADAPKDRKGQRKEQGLGSPVNQTQQSIDAYKRWCGPGKPNEEPDFADNLKRMEAELAATNARKKAEAEKNAKGRRRRFTV